MGCELEQISGIEIRHGISGVFSGTVQPHVGFGT